MPKKGKKILIIGPFPEPITGVSLANKVVAEVLRDSNEYRVRIINTSYSRFDEEVGSFSLHKFLFNLSFYLGLWRVLFCDILYITPGQTFYGVLKYAGFVYVSSLSRKQIITHIHGNYLGREYQSLRGLRKRLVKSVLSKTTTGIVLSSSLRNNMSPFIKQEAIKVLPNFAQDYIAQSNKKKQEPGLRVIYLSNLMREKGIFHLLGALQILEDTKVPYEARIAGAIDKNQKSHIMTLISKLENTSYVGVVQGESKKGLLQWGNVFTLPTFYKMEGQPISILEALATKNVIITTAHAGIPDIITDQEHGFFIDISNAEEEIASKFTHLINSPELLASMGEGNEAYFQENFTLDIFKNKLLNIFES